MVQLHSPALKTQKVEVGVALMLCYTKYLPPFHIQYKLSMAVFHRAPCLPLQVSNI